MTSITGTIALMKKDRIPVPEIRSNAITMNIIALPM
jgi:hypothetical protein